MQKISVVLTGTLIGLGISCASVMAQTVRDWKAGLGGARLASYQSGVVTSNSSLTILDLCRSGRYSYTTDNGWYIPGQASGASQSSITGQWDIVSQQKQFYFVYRTDRGQSGHFPIYLTNNGKVNIGGTLFSVQRGGARC